MAAVRPRVEPLLAVGGILASSVAVLAGGRANTATTVPPTKWFGLLSPVGYRPGGPWVFGLILFLGIAALVVAWLLAIRLTDRGALTERQLWRIAGCWSFPFVVGPPLISKDVYSYAAQGLMLRHGLDVYSSGVAVLGRVACTDAVRAVAAVDPSWRETPSPYGPLASAIERVSVEISGGNPVGAVIVLRAFAVLSVIASARLAASLADPNRTGGLLLVALNPLVLVQAVSAAHFEAVLCALLLASLTAAKRGRWGLAIVLVCAAAAVKAPAFVALPAFVTVHAISERRRGSGRGLVSRTVAIDLAVSAVSFGALSLLVPNGLGWLHNLTTPGQSRTSSALSADVGALLRSIFPSSLSSQVTTAALAAGLAVAGCLVLYLTATAMRRPLEVTVGFSLLAVALLAPVIYPWYVLWGAVCLLPTAPAVRRNRLVALCGFASVAAITGAPTAATAPSNLLTLGVAGYLLLRRPSTGRGAGDNVRVDVSRQAGLGSDGQRSADRRITRTLPDQGQDNTMTP